MTDAAADLPRTLASRSERDRRKAMLRDPHIAPLTDYAESLRRPDIGVPCFDPLDGGTNAKILFLLEKPGPMTDPEGGSGFISRNNDDPTADAIFQFMERAGIDRKLTVLWNVIPGWNKTIKIASDEFKDGRQALPGLLALLPELQVVALVGARAAKARDEIESRGLKVIISDHPSRKVRSIYRERWNAIPEKWRTALDYLA